MTTVEEQGRRIAAALTDRVGCDANAAQVAEAIITTVLEIEAAIAPIVGKRGVAELFKRSLFLVTATCPDLRTDSAGLPALVDAAALRKLFARQDAATVMAGGSLFLQTFYDLLASLIGMSLTERVLRTAWIPFTRSPSGQDSSS